MSQSIAALDDLVSNGDISSYELDLLDIDGVPIPERKEGFRNTERLTIIFPSGRKVVVNTACSGCLENTYLEISDR
jgi:hypothetical protein